MPLAAQLRARTSADHAAVEVAFHLERRLVDRETYGGLLLALRRFYAPMEQSLARVIGWERLTPPILLRRRRRAHLLDQDLTKLDISLPSDRASARPQLPVLGSLARGLGCLYVLEGSALGGRIVARRAREALGPGLPEAFFTSAGRTDQGADWRSLLGALDAFGTKQGTGGMDQVVAAAGETFAALTTALNPAGDPR